jgi:hypothetical protein
MHDIGPASATPVLRAKLPAVRVASCSATLNFLIPGVSKHQPK